MAQNANQKKASGKVAAWLAHNELENSWLAEKAKADAGTIGDFLNGLRWPKRGTQGRIEKALGWPPGSIHQMGQGDTPDLPMTPATVGGNPQDAPQYVESPGERVDGGLDEDEVLRRLDQMQEDIRAMSEWVARRRQERSS